MQYTPHYNLNLPEGTDIVNPLIQDNPNYTAIDTALYNNKLRVIGTATHVKTGTNHAITLGDSDINQFKFVATGDYASGDTFTVDGVTVTPRIANGTSLKNLAFVVNSIVLCILDGSLLNIINVDGNISADDVGFNNSGTDLTASNAEAAIKEVNDKGVLYVNVPIGNVAVTNTEEFANTGFYYAEVSAVDYVPTGYEIMSVGIYGNWNAVTFIPKGRGFVILSAKPYTLPAGRTARVWYHKI